MHESFGECMPRFAIHFVIIMKSAISLQLLKGKEPQRESHTWREWRRVCRQHEWIYLCLVFQLHSAPQKQFKLFVFYWKNMKNHNFLVSFPKYIAETSAKGKHFFHGTLWLLLTKEQHIDIVLERFNVCSFLFVLMYLDIQLELCQVLHKNACSSRKT